MITLILGLLLNIGDLSLDRARFLFGDDSIVIDYVNHKYLTSSKAPFILVFDNNNRFQSIAWRESLFASPGSKSMFRKLDGKWTAIAMDLWPTTTPAVVSWAAWYNLEITGDVATIDYGIIRQKYICRYHMIGRVLRIAISFPNESDLLAFVEDRENDLGLLSQYVIVLDSCAIWWRSVPTAKYGRMAFLVRLRQ